MRSTLRIIPALILGLTFFQTRSNAQCSGGSFQSNITPTAATQTVAVPNAGLYYTFNGIGGAVYQFSFCAADGGSASYDTQLTMLDNTGAYAGGYNDDWCGLQSFLQWTCPSSGVYRVLVARYYCNLNGGSAATLAYKILPPANDNCSGALSIALSGSIAGSTSLANTDVAPSCTVGDDPSGGVWYTFTGDGNQIVASLCGSTFDTRIRAFTGSCGSLNCVAGNDDFCGPQSQITFCTFSGFPYYILVYGNAGANGNFTLTMSENFVVNPVVTPTSASYCGSGSVNITASGYTIYNWGPAAGLNTTVGANVIASPTVTTTYTVAVTDAGTGCPAFATSTITVNTIPTVTTSASPGVICGGGNSTLTANGASTYTWMPGSLSGSSVTVSPMTTTTYTVTGTSVQGCTNTATVTVIAQPLPNVTITPLSDSICIGGFTTLNASGASTYSWNPTGSTATSINVAPTTTTSYVLTGTDAQGCVNRDTLNLVVNPLPNIVASATNYSVCLGSAAYLNGSGGISYVWSDGNTTNPDTTFPNTTTTYSVTGTDANGCSNTDTARVSVLWAPPVTPTASVNTICPGGGSVLFASGGAQSYLWTPGNMTTSSVTVYPTSTTYYVLTGTYSNGCVRTDSVQLTVLPAPVVTVTTPTNPVCGGTNSVLTASGANSYSWSPGNMAGSSVTVNPNSTTVYTVTGTGANGCTGDTTYTLTVNPAPNISVSGPAIICTGNSATLNASGATSYNWNPGSLSGASVTVTPSSSTTYTITGTDAAGCNGSTMFNVAVATPPNVIAYGAVTNACTADASVFLTGVPSGGTFSGPGVAGSLFSPSSAGVGPHTVTYTYTDANGCTNTATFTITVSACVGVQELSGMSGVDFYPNPNDGTFNVNVASDNIRTMNVDIYDLEGRLVYSELLDGITMGYRKTIDVSSLANGTFYIRFSSEGNSVTQKLVILK
ncbi:MAG: T9SS type A sorting domain-containing protein [Bacteroidetes bacterium]|nr:T9SS type A sorting domain-containing protein [Bacteroidota bacterium]